MIEYIQCTCGLNINKKLRERHLTTTNHFRWSRRGCKKKAKYTPEELNQVVECDCGIILKRRNLNYHYNTIVHKKYTSSPEGQIEQGFISSSIGEEKDYIPKRKRAYWYVNEFTNSKPLVVSVEHNVTLDFED